jgi:hypothetical protein
MRANKSPEYKAGFKAGKKAGYRKGREDARIHLMNFATDSVAAVVADITKRSGISPMLWADPAEQEKIIMVWRSKATEMMAANLEIDRIQEKG